MQEGLKEKRMLWRLAAVDPQKSSCLWIQCVSLVILLTGTTTVLASEGLRSKNGTNVEMARRLNAVTPVDDQTLSRFKSVPRGFRKHPSYYSETYLPRTAPEAVSSAAEWEALTKKWGQWTFSDPKFSTRPKNDFYDQFPHRDVPYDKWPDTAWQKDPKYVSQFLSQALALTQRALKGIDEEYGGRAEYLFKIKIDGNAKVGQEGGGWIPSQSYAGLKQRILHSIVAQDRFTLAMGGHSSSAGHGNHFQQSYMMQIQRILEPLFARLGVKLTARNFGMGGLGTLHNALAAGDLYGKDVDILMWDSGMTESKADHLGLFAIQGLVSMDRAPLLWYERDKGFSLAHKFLKTVGADVALYGISHRWDMEGVNAETKEELNELPWALRYFGCSKKIKNTCKKQRWIGQCWYPSEKDFMWRNKLNVSHHYPRNKQDKTMGGRASWHPGNREHQLSARAFTYTILHALQDALMEWNATAANNYKLPDSTWHVAEKYQAIKSKIAQNVTLWTGWCKTMSIPEEFCYMPAHGRTENTPRYQPWATNLRALMRGSEHENMLLHPNEYDPPDNYNPSLDPPDKKDVNLLAIVENGNVPFQPNLARIQDSARDMQGPRFTGEEIESKQLGTGSRHNPDIRGGQGWQFPPGAEAGSVGTDNCDGEYDSWCRRAGKCLRYGHNDARLGLLFDEYSGWMIFHLPKVKRGVVMIKLHTWKFDAPPITANWCSTNNIETNCEAKEEKKQRVLLSSEAGSERGRTEDLEDSSDLSADASPRRQLKGQPPKYCENFQFKFAINGKITSWNKEEFQSRVNKAQRVVELVTLMDNKTWASDAGPNGRDVEVAIRMRGCGRAKPMELTHLYWI